jgi:hypothetical protein
MNTIFKGAMHYIPNNLLNNIEIWYVSFLLFFQNNGV